MNKILKILSILVIGFVMFSCSTPTNDSTPYIPDESGPETPEVQTYSITFVAEDTSLTTTIVVGYLNSLSQFKTLKENDTVSLIQELYISSDEKVTENKIEDSVAKYFIQYDGENIEEIEIGNKDVKIEVGCANFEIF